MIKKIGLFFSFSLLSFLALSSIPTAQAAAPASELSLVSARNLPGSFLNSKAIFADQKYIYLASAQGQLFVLANDSDFPLLQTLTVSAQPLTAVASNSRFVFVSAKDGNLYQISKKDWQIKQSWHLSDYGLSSVVSEGDQTVVGLGQASLALSNNILYLSQLNEGDIAQKIDPLSGEVLLTYGSDFAGGVTRAYDLNSGILLATLTNSFSSPALFITNHNLIQTQPGCCGTGADFFNKTTLENTGRISRSFINTLDAENQWLATGGEDSSVGVYDLQSKNILASLNLSQTTGHNNPEDIEIRSLAISRNFILAASSWGNSTTRSTDLPTFFVLRFSKATNEITANTSAQSNEATVQISSNPITSEISSNALTEKPLFPKTKLDSHGLPNIVADDKRKIIV